jgi:hypothetical protein
MDSGGCHYDCAKPPERLASNSDISGVGVSVSSACQSIRLTTWKQVSLAYTITAGLAVGIVLMYYISVYLPDGYMLNSQQQHTTPSTQNSPPNPIDYYLLYWRLDTMSKASQTNARNNERWNKVNVALQHVRRLRSSLSLCMSQI